MFEAIRNRFSFENHKEKEKIQRAKKGVKAYKEIYTAQDQETKRLISTSDFGDRFKSLILGVKPSILLTGEETRFISANSIRINNKLNQDYGFVEVNENGVGKSNSIFYSKKQVSKIVLDNADVFQDFQRKSQTIEAYVEKIIKEYNNDRTIETEKKLGMLLGFPKKSVLNYEKYFRARNLYADALDRDKKFADWYYENIPYKDVATQNKFKDENEERCRKEYKRVLGDELNSEEIEYLVTLRTINEYGYEFQTNDFNKDKEFIEDVRRVHKKSGIEREILILQFRDVFTVSFWEDMFLSRGGNN